MKYQKKPVIIEALQWDGSSHRPMFDFLDGTHRSHMATNGTNFYIDHSKVEGGLIIKTLEGEHLANIGDWIIKGVEGEFYPCKPAIFKKTYDPVSLENAPGCARVTVPWTALFALL
jgi:hypothetical protein